MTFFSDLLAQARNNPGVSHRKKQTRLEFRGPDLPLLDPGELAILKPGRLQVLPDPARWNPEKTGSLTGRREIRNRVPEGSEPGHPDHVMADPVKDQMGTPQSHPEVPGSPDIPGSAGSNVRRTVSLKERPEVPGSSDIPGSADTNVGGTDSLKERPGIRWKHPEVTEPAKRDPAGTDPQDGRTRSWIIPAAPEPILPVPVETDPLEENPGKIRVALGILTTLPGHISSRLRNRILRRFSGYEEGFTRLRIRRPA